MRRFSGHRVLLPRQSGDLPLSDHPARPCGPGLAQALTRAFAAEGVTVLEAAELNEQ